MLLFAVRPSLHELNIHLPKENQPVSVVNFRGTCWGHGSFPMSLTPRTLLCDNIFQAEKILREKANQKQ